MSPAIFVLCLEKLSQVISHKVGAGSWKGIKLDSKGPTLSHLCFADDTILFSKASLKQAEIISDCLNRFCVASGQRISYNKSQIYFSKNTNHELTEDIANKLNIARREDLGKYLGVPSIHGCVTCSTFSSLLDRMNTRLEG